MSVSLWPQGLQHARPPCPWLSPGVCPSSCPLSCWFHQPPHSLLPSSPLAFSLSQNRVFPNESTVCIRWPKCWSFSFRIRPSNKYSRLISFRTDWFYLLATQRIIKSLFLQHHNLKASILWHSAFFKVQLSHLYVTTGKTITLTIWIFVGKVMSLFFNMLSRFVITFLPRSKRLLISWLQSLSSVIFLSPGCLSITPFPTARS